MICDCDQCRYDNAAGYTSTLIIITLLDRFNPAKIMDEESVERVETR